MNNTYNLSALDRIAEEWVMDKSVPEVYGEIKKGRTVIGHSPTDDGGDFWYQLVNSKADLAHNVYQLVFFSNDADTVVNFEVRYEPDYDSEGNVKRDAAGNIIYKTFITQFFYTLNS